MWTKVTRKKKKKAIPAAILPSAAAGEIRDIRAARCERLNHLLGLGGPTEVDSVLGLDRTGHEAQRENQETARAGLAQI